MSGYQLDFGAFPRGFLDSPSIHAASLRYLGLSSVYDCINFSVDGDGSHPANLTAKLAAPASFMCPADPQARVSVLFPGYVESPTSYAGNRGGGVQRYGYNGIFPGPGDPLVTPASVTDGLSSTAMLSEWLVGDDGRNPLRTNFHTARKLTAPNELDAFAALCDHIDAASARIAPHPKGDNWLKGDFAYTFYNHVCRINGHSCLNGSGFQTGAWTACSLHGRGAHLAFADGHVSFLSDSLDLSAWRAIAGRADGQIVELP